MTDLAALRAEYARGGLDAADLGGDPIEAVARWLHAAEAAGLPEPNAMVLATVADGIPSARLVLLKRLDDRGLVFYTNNRSRKATELRANPACALLFPWHGLARQVRIEGVAAQVGTQESDSYFATRPRASQLGAWASPQSEPVASRAELEQRYAHQVERFASYDEVPRPPYWGGYRVRPDRVEFWQGRTGRMHDRVVFDRVDEDQWDIQRLAP